MSHRKAKKKQKGSKKKSPKAILFGKKKRRTIKELIAVDTKSQKIIATSQSCGNTHDFKIYKESKNHVHPDTKNPRELRISGHTENTRQLRTS